MSWCEIPVPPSINHAHHIMKTAGGKRFVGRSKDYRDWLEAAVLLLRIGLRKLAEPCEVSIRITSGKGWRVIRDIDNVIKPIVDAIKHAGRIPDDNSTWVKKVSVEYLPGNDGKAKVLVQLQPYEVTCVTD